MVEQSETEATSDIEFKLLSVATLIKKVKNEITHEELYRDAERKFDTLIELLNDTYMDNTILNKFGYSLVNLKDISLLIFNRLISDANTNSYMTLCVSEDASSDEIRRRRNMLLSIFHPDKNLEKHANGDKARRINEAYDNIINNKNNKADMILSNVETNIPPSYPYDHDNGKKMKMMVLLIILFSLLVVLWVTNKSFFI